MQYVFFDEKLFYTNDLHDALLKKQGKVFWNCWRSNKHSIKHVDGVTDPDVIAEHFASHFSKVCVKYGGR